MKVTVNHYANGNVEFIPNYVNKNSTKNAEQGDDVTFISEQHLQCKLSGVLSQ